ncbi:hemerythrin domain-containing protein [Paenibacillus koleovorans]|uniref:hemerythrin domain-containing protein n=1 Tax=Paenibacillus koleovorans TaxID=121608 RepID=UPI000FD78FD4|nr:hemerythrin domain-containing protein [Paenibacillus koleovorans]
MNSGAGNAEIRLCEPLQRLKQEHIPLRMAMDAFYSTAQQLDEETGIEQNDLVHTWLDQVADFTVQLKKHSIKEDDGLFPMMANYMGRTVGPIAVMEYEHEQAEHYLQRFLEAAGQGERARKHEEIRMLAGYAVQAYTILTQHFGKEEAVLFPLAENMLSPEEKQQLNRIVQEK